MLSGGNIGASAGNYQTTTGDVGASYGSPVDASHVMHMSLTEGMDHNWPFGISILEPIFKVFKQKELLEDRAKKEKDSVAKAEKKKTDQA